MDKLVKILLTLLIISLVAPFLKFDYIEIAIILLLTIFMYLILGKKDKFDFKVYLKVIKVPLILYFIYTLLVIIFETYAYQNSSLEAVKEFYSTYLHVRILLSIFLACIWIYAGWKSSKKINSVKLGILLGIIHQITSLILVIYYFTYFEVFRMGALQKYGDLLNLIAHSIVGIPVLFIISAAFVSFGSYMSKKFIEFI